jgi:secreted trypsin-like serine protease
VNFILTAAHCLDDLISIDVIAGTANIFQGNPAYRATVKAKDIRQYPGYDKGTLRDDIGLIALRKEIRPNLLIAPVKLLTRSMVLNNFLWDRDRPFLIGWGRTSNRKFKRSFEKFQKNF